VEKIEQEEDESAALTSVRCILDQAERRGAVVPDAAQLAVEIGLPRREQCHGRCDRRLFTRPVEPSPGQQSHLASVQPGMHPVTVEFDFMEPLGPVRWRVDQFGELGFQPFRER
jgi:hypothetical protein